MLKPVQLDEPSRKELNNPRAHTRLKIVALVTKREQRYLGAGPLTHLNVRMPTVHFNILLTGSQFKSLRTGVMCSNFLEPVTTLAAKFWTLCSLETFFFDVLDHTGEQ